MRARRKALDDIKRQPTTHAGLWLDKFLLEQNEQGREGDAGVGAKGEHIRSLANHPVPPGYAAAFARWHADLVGDVRAHVAEAEAEGRIAIGLGAKGVIEAGLTLDYTWGTPVLPGSALKGLAARVADRLVVEDDWRKSVGGRPGASYAAMFGTTDQAGLVRFLDAWWDPTGTDRLPIDLDTMTVHHPDYYQQPPGGQRPPSDTDSPTPVAFATTQGRFLVAVEANTADPADAAPWIDAAFELLKLGLDELGIGAKTNAGYGRMTLEWKSAEEARLEFMSPADRADVEFEPLLVGGLDHQVAWLLGAEGDPKQPPSVLPDPGEWKAWVAARLADAIAEIRRRLVEGLPELNTARADLRTLDDAKPSRNANNARKALKNWNKKRDKLLRTIDNLERQAANEEGRQRSMVSWFEA